MHKQPRLMSMVYCTGCSSRLQPAAVELYGDVVAAVPVLPPGVHLFRGSLVQLRHCGVEM
jgi:hypothetical protein